MPDQAFQIDFAFLKTQEGYKTKVYVPTCTVKSVLNTRNKPCYGKQTGSVIGKSGPTVGGGIDLGQRNADDLRRVGIRPELVKKLTPLLNQKGSHAQVALQSFNKKNLVISPKEVKEIDSKVKMSMAHSFAAQYNRDTGKSLNDLPAGIQTALFSLFYQYGLKAISKYKWGRTLWGHVKKKDWPEVIKTYQDLAKRHGYRSRREAEIQLIAQAIR